MPSYIGQDIEGFGLLLGLPLLVVVVVVVVVVVIVEAIGPGIMIGGTCLCSKYLLLQLFPCKRSGRLLPN